MTAPTIPLCPLPDAHPATCPCPRRSAETYYGHPIATTRDISTYQEQHMTDQPTFLTSPTDAEQFLVAIEEPLEQHLLPDVALLERVRDDVMRVVMDLISVPCFPCRYQVEGGDEVGRLHPACQKALYGVGPCGEACSEMHTYGDGCEQAEYASDAASQPRTAADNPAASGDAADNRPWRWAETIAAHGVGDTYTIDIDAEHPGGDQIIIECTLTQASELNAMLTDAINEGTPARPPFRLASTDDALTGCNCDQAPCEHTPDARVRAAAQVAVDSVVKALSATREEFALTGQVEDPELTAEEARDLADRLSIDLYRAQDALAFVEECCVIADREGQPVTTARVRQWLQGPQCGRQLLATPALPERAQAAIRAAVEQVQVRDRQLAAVREYVRTSDDDGIRTREHVLRVLGAGGEVGP